MTTYPNQKTITINREMPKQTKGNKRPYMIAYNDNIEKAMQNINKVSSFKLYIYLLSNNNFYNFALSTKDVSERCGISLDSAQDAVKDLIEKGYLVLIEKKHYDFYETPKVSIEVIGEEKKVFKIDDIPRLITYDELVNLLNGKKEQADDLWRRNRNNEKE